MSVQAPSFENLLPELLLALVGHVGGAFVQKNESNDLGDATGSFRLVPEVDWVSQAERYDVSFSLSPTHIPKLTWICKFYAENN